MKILLLMLLLTLTACSSIPKLEVGSCYDVSLYATHDPDDWASGSTMHELSKFKIVGIFTFEGSKHYAIQVLASDFSKGHYDLVPLYSKSNSYGYAAVRQFDKYISPNAGKFSPNEEKTIKCNPITDLDVVNGEKTPRFPLMRVGTDINGIEK